MLAAMPVTMPGAVSTVPDLPSDAEAKANAASQLVRIVKNAKYIHTPCHAPCPVRQDIWIDRPSCSSSMAQVTPAARRAYQSLNRFLSTTSMGGMLHLALGLASIRAGPNVSSRDSVRPEPPATAHR